MINLLLGAPGAGKSFEAVVFHVLPALLSGRKVITNLPLILKEFDSIQPGLSDLIDLRTDKLGEFAFSSPDHYFSDWRNENNQGPLIVIDECHKALPRSSSKSVPHLLKTCEFLAEHRHAGIDVLLITQSYGKINRDIIDMVQVVWRCRKNIAFGSPNTYVRKTLDGVRGQEMGTVIRKYDKQYFPLYKSHTHSNGSVDEAMTGQIKPFWQHWTFIGAGLCFVVVGYMGFQGYLNPFKAAAAPVPTVAVHQQLNNTPNTYQSLTGNSSLTPVKTLDVEPQKAVEVNHPFKGLEPHISGVIKNVNRVSTMISFSRNGGFLFFVTDREMIEAGYTLTRLTDCAWDIKYGDFEIIAVCDQPQIGITTSAG